MQHADDAGFLIRFQNVVERFQLKGLHRMFFPRGDKHDKRLVGKLTDVLCQQHAVQWRNVDVEEDRVHFVVLQKFQHVQTVVKGADNLHLAVLLNQPG